MYIKTLMRKYNKCQNSRLIYRSSHDASVLPRNVLEKSQQNRQLLIQGGRLRSNKYTLINLMIRAYYTHHDDVYISIRMDVKHCLCPHAFVNFKLGMLQEIHECHTILFLLFKLLLVLTLSVRTLKLHGKQPGLLTHLFFCLLFVHI